MPVNPTSGYPRLKIDGSYEYVHIVWWEHANGPPPKGDDGEPLTVDHTCEFGKGCVWPGCKRLLSRPANTAPRWETRTATISVRKYDYLKRSRVLH